VVLFLTGAKEGFLLRKFNIVPENRPVSRSMGIGDSFSEDKTAGVSRWPHTSNEYSTSLAYTGKTLPVYMRMPLKCRLKFKLPTTIVNVIYSFENAA